MASALMYLSGPTSQIERGDVALVAPVKNEIALLPHFLDWHRRLGVRRFFLIDNGSTDGSRDFLSTQPDVSLFATDQSFYEARFGLDWMEEVLRRHCVGRWAVYADCDEFLTYRDCETVDVRDYCRTAEGKGFDTVLGAMIDVYPEGDFLAAKVPPPGCPIFGEINRFDSNYLFRRWPARPWDAPPARFPLEVIGGPRCRILSSVDKLRRKGALTYTFYNQADRFIRFTPVAAIPALAAVWPLGPSVFHKQPINLISPDFRMFSCHDNSNTRISDDFVALLHVKLCDELSKRLAQADVMANHHHRGLAYEQLRQALGRWKRPTLVYEGTRTYRSSADLLAVGLIGPAVAALWTKPGLHEIETPAAA